MPDCRDFFASRDDRDTLSGSAISVSLRATQSGQASETSVPLRERQRSSKMSPIIAELRKQQQIMFDLLQKFNDHAEGYEESSPDSDSDLEMELHQSDDV